MKSFFGFFVVLVLILSFFSPLGLIAQEKKEGEEIYTIKRGDTLWDISSRFMNSPFLWPKLWQQNPYITNPHWIYPGKPIRLTPLEAPAKDESKKIAATEEKPREEIKEPSVKKEEPPTEKKKTEVVVEEKAPEEKPSALSETRSAGFFSDIDYRGIGYVLESKEGKNLLAAGDICYVGFRHKNPVLVGERYTTFTSNPGIISVDIEFGRRYNITGVIQILDKYGDFYTAKILESFQEINKGDFIMPYNKEKMGVGTRTK